MSALTESLVWKWRSTEEQSTSECSRFFSRKLFFQRGDFDRCENERLGLHCPMLFNEEQFFLDRRSTELFCCWNELDRSSFVRGLDARQRFQRGETAASRLLGGNHRFNWLLHGFRRTRSAVGRDSSRLLGNGALPVKNLGRSTHRGGGGGEIQRRGRCVCRCGGKVRETSAGTWQSLRTRGDPRIFQRLKTSSRMTEVQEQISTAESLSLLDQTRPTGLIARWPGGFTWQCPVAKKDSRFQSGTMLIRTRSAVSLLLVQSSVRARVCVSLIRCSFTGSMETENQRLHIISISYPLSWRSFVRETSVRVRSLGRIEQFLLISRFHLLGVFASLRLILRLKQTKDVEQLLGNIHSTFSL